MPSHGARLLIERAFSPLKYLVEFSRPSISLLLDRLPMEPRVWLTLPLSQDPDNLDRRYGEHW